MSLNLYCVSFTGPTPMVPRGHITIVVAAKSKRQAQRLAYELDTKFSKEHCTVRSLRSLQGSEPNVILCSPYTLVGDV